MSEAANIIPCDVCGVEVSIEDTTLDSAFFRACPSCRAICEYEGCGRFIGYRAFNMGRVEGLYVCDRHPVAECISCDERYFSEDMYNQWRDEYVCMACYDGRCPECGGVYGLDGDLCEDCRYYRDDDGDEEVLDTSAEVDEFKIRPFSEDRGEMLVSYELEFGRDPEPMAETLYHRGYSNSPDMGSYSAGGNCVKYDGSVDGGGELVASKMLLPRARDTRRFWGIFQVLRDAVKSGDNRLDSRCGLHIHVDASRLPLGQVMSTAVVFNYLEDIMFRLAAAHWSNGHRSSSGNDYSKPNPKDIASKGRFRHMFGDRYLGLNLGNYMAHRQSCRCGAGYDRADLCTCERGKMTLEYRLFNTTANPIKMHAYTALSCAFVAYGKGKELLATDLAPMTFTYRNIDYGDVGAYVSRLVWMFENLPLSAEERDSIRYTIRNSDIGPMLESHLRNDPESVYANDIKGILDNDSYLKIPVFIAPREDEQPAPAPEPLPVPPITEDTLRDEYGDLVYPITEDACDRRRCRVCYRAYDWREVEAWQNEQNLNNQAPAEQYAPRVPDHGGSIWAERLDNLRYEGCLCGACQVYMAQQWGYQGQVYFDRNDRGHFRWADGRFCPSPQNWVRQRIDRANARHAFDRLVAQEASYSFVDDDPYYDEF